VDFAGSRKITPPSQAIGKSVVLSHPPLVKLIEAHFEPVAICNNIIKGISAHIIATLENKSAKSPWNSALL